MVLCEQANAWPNDHCARHLLLEPVQAELLNNQLLRRLARNRLLLAALVVKAIALVGLG